MLSGMMCWQYAAALCRYESLFGENGYAAISANRQIVVKPGMAGFTCHLQICCSKEKQVEPHHAMLHHRPLNKLDRITGRTYMAKLLERTKTNAVGVLSFAECCLTN
jgi:hypothetical protein